MHLIPYLPIHSYTYLPSNFAYLSSYLSICFSFLLSISLYFFSLSLSLSPSLSSFPSVFVFSLSLCAFVSVLISDNVVSSLFLSFLPCLFDFLPSVVIHFSLFSLCLSSLLPSSFLSFCVSCFYMPEPIDQSTYLPVYLLTICLSMYLTFPYILPFIRARWDNKSSCLMQE